MPLLPEPIAPVICSNSRTSSVVYSTALQSTSAGSKVAGRQAGWRVIACNIYDEQSAHPDRK